MPELHSTMEPSGPPGLGLRREHYGAILAGDAIHTRWFEAITENYLDSKGRPRAILRKVREDYPLALHGVSLSIATANHPGHPHNFVGRALSRQYMNRWKELIHEVQPFLVSDHLCWTRSQQLQSHDLLPIGYDDRWLNLIAENVDRVQSFLKRPIALENVSSYVSWVSDTMPEWEFLNRLCDITGCGILLDINNVTVNAHNHGFSSAKFIESIDAKHVWQYHIAGHSILGAIRFDTHGQSVQSEVRQLYIQACEKIGPRPLLLERDQDIPDLAELEDELRVIHDSGCNAPARRLADSERAPAPSGAHHSPDSGEFLKVSGIGPDLIAGEAKSGLRKDRQQKPDSRSETIETVQKQFVESLYSGKMSSDLGDALKGAGSPAMDSVESLNVYRQSVLSRLQEALEELYSPLSYEPDFQEWVQGYIEANPARHYNLSEYGDGFAGWIRPSSSRAAEVARLCLLFNRYFHVQRPGGGWIQEIPGRSGFSRDIAVLSVEKSAFVSWRSQGKAGNHTTGEIETEFQEAAGKRVWLLLYRDSGQIMHRELKDFEAGLICRLLRGAGLERTMEWLADFAPALDEQSVFQFFQFLTSKGLYRPPDESLA